ncbi:Uu.00g068280.m01.CDS01 [Anthostomella pinea]|uniref:Uu.00g068280.m01.CDS01 n=1 Tax=Anthostomella pinea TaxID=933095 RepID=A0AAI8VVH9_9PEZI|nr:Uu.00g068280.m01.CDS01 [Anthostomella pinea]
MAANDARQPQVCVTCKSRKKKCDKVSPTCGYCTLKGLSCSYQDVADPHGRATAVADPEGTRRVTTRPTSDEAMISHVVGVPSASDRIPAEPTAMKTNLYLQVNRMIRSTGQFVDDVSARYFQSVHRFLPFISRARFHDNLITLGAAPAADFSIILLSICLITHNSVTRTTWPEAADEREIYVSARSLFAQLQAVLPPSVHLIQAGLLLAEYEYACGEADTAFTTIAGCARMAYAARIHSHSSAKVAQGPAYTTELEKEEAANTWWALVICERMIAFEVTVPEQPLVTLAPSEDARLPTEPEVLDRSDVLDRSSICNVVVSSLFTIEVGGFGRAAQAASLADRVIQAFSIADLRSRLVHLDALDSALQSFLTTVLSQCHGQWGIYCAAIALAIRTIFALHWHILDLPGEEIVNANYRSPEKWFSSSHASLQTASRMSVDIADYHESVPQMEVLPLNQR